MSGSVTVFASGAYQFVVSGGDLRPIASGQIGAVIYQTIYGGCSAGSPLTLASGGVLQFAESYPHYAAVKCRSCQATLGLDRVSVMGVSGLHMLFCMSCAGWNEEKKRFLTREDYIREDLPKWLEGFPNPVVADWLEEQQRYNDARRMRNLPPPGSMSEH